VTPQPAVSKMVVSMSYYIVLPSKVVNSGTLALIGVGRTPVEGL
jgi:hypothetical protein